MDIRRTRTLLVCFALLLAAVFAMLSRQHDPAGHIAPGQPDFYAYQQYGRAIADGHPYRFNEGDPPTTGSTSHIYPFVLALPQVIGLGGPWVADFAFVFNAFCFAGFLLCFHATARHINAEAAPLATALVLLCGQTLYTFFAGSDMPLFALVFWAAAASLVNRRFGLAAGLLFILPWVRPDGVLPAFALGLVLAWESWKPGGEGKPERRFWLPVIAGFLGLAAVLLTNRALTGHFGFDSTRGKGLFKFHPFLEVFRVSAANLASLVLGVLFGVSNAAHRYYFILPLVGGLLALFGLACRKRGLGTVEGGLAISALLGLLLIGASSSEGMHYDRHLTWALPVWLLYAAVGVQTLTRDRPVGRTVLISLLIAWQLVGVGWYATKFAGDSAALHMGRTFLARQAETLPEKPAFGVSGGGGLVLTYIPGSHAANVGAITSSRFSVDQAQLAVTEILKHEEKQRFGYWMLSVHAAQNEWMEPLVGEQMAASSPIFGAANSFGIYEADWSLLDPARKPLTETVSRVTQGLKMVARCDVGYDVDEAMTRYYVHNRIPGSRVHPFLLTGSLGDASLAEVGRVIYGYEQFEIPVDPDRPLVVVLRTALQATASTSQPGMGLLGTEYAFAAPMMLRVFVGSEQVGDVPVPAPDEGDTFVETIFTIPAEALDGPVCRLVVGGDHISAAWWFYQ